MNIHVIKHTSNWGETIRTHHMESRGLAFYNSYFYPNLPKDIYFSDLHVSIDWRKKGLGQLMLNHHLNSALLNGFEFSYLWVDKNSFQENWYKKNGYEFYKEKDEFQNWLFKKLV